MAKNLTDPEMVSDLYLATVSRPPTDKEMRIILKHVAGAADKRKAWEDVHWTVINTKEFLFRH